MADIAAKHVQPEDLIEVNGAQVRVISSLPDLNLPGHRDIRGRNEAREPVRFIFPDTQRVIVKETTW